MARNEIVEPGLSVPDPTGLGAPYPTDTMFACTEFSVASDGWPEVMTPSKNDPIEPLLLSPPMPRMIAPSLCIGEYPDGEVGSAPEYRVASPPDCALPLFR